ncbi:MAG: tetratricopeptide repeat protein [Hyphomonadaceae bacterium]|nr:tetratricopeptide repeat protein [Hyphomonadaceae bacterium]
MTRVVSIVSAALACGIGLFAAPCAFPQSQKPGDLAASAIQASERGDRAGAAREFDAALAQNPDDVRALIGRCNLRMQERDFAAAQVDCARAAALEPESGIVLGQLGFVFLASGDAEKASRTLDAALALMPSNTEMLSARGAASPTAAEAMPYFNAALRNDPRYARALAGRGFAWLEIDQPQHAEADFRALLALGSNAAEAHYGLGLALSAQEATDEAIAALDRAIALSPSYAAAYYERGVLHGDSDTLELALADYDMAVQLAPDIPNFLTSRAWVLRERGEFTRALADLDRALALDPSNTFALTNRGATRYSLGDIPGALADLNESIRLDPDDPHAYLSRGGVYANTNEDALALADFTEHLRLDPASPPGYRFRSVIRGRLGDAAGSIADADAFAGMTPDDPSGLNSRCWARAVANAELDVALATCDRAIASEDTSQYRDSRGLVFLRLGRYAEAWADYDAAVRMKPDDAHALYGRGLAAVRLGRAHDGDADLARATALRPQVAQDYARYGVTP